MLELKNTSVQAKIIRNLHAGGLLRMAYDCNEWQNPSGQELQAEQLLTIAWNRGEEQTVDIDGQTYTCPSNTLVALLANQSFRFERPGELIAWQFNREFYCIIDHDEEVSCAGLLFYGSADLPLVTLSPEDARKINFLYQVFMDEFDDHDRLQEDMLRMLLKRLIIKTTRYYKEQVGLSKLPAVELDLFRQFNLLVEKHYKQWHQVQDYATALHKSPKTLSNLFAQLEVPTPLRIIHARIVLEAKRMLRYTDFSVKEIAYELGFKEVPPFNRMFKKVSGLTPSAFQSTPL